MKKSLLIFLLSVVWGLAGLTHVSAESKIRSFSKNVETNWSSIELNPFMMDWTPLGNFLQGNNFNFAGADFLNPPTQNCYFGEGGIPNYFEDAYELNGVNFSASSFIVPAGKTFELKQLNLALVTTNDISTLSIKIFNDSYGMPSNELLSINAAPNETTLLGTLGGDFSLFDVQYNLSNSLMLNAGRYWVAVAGTDSVGGVIYWETTMSFSNGGSVYGNSGNWFGYFEDYVFYVGGNCSDTGACNAVSIPYTEDFNGTYPLGTPDCTKVEHVTPSTRWFHSNDVNSPFTSGHLAYQYHSTNNGNTWFFTKGINLTAGNTYKISYQYANYGSSDFPESMKVAMGSSASIGAMNTVLADYPNIVNTSPATANIVFTVPSTGVYYFGFHAYSPADRYVLVLDNISVDLASEDEEEEYCEPLLICSDGDLISNVSFKEIYNTTGCSPNGYGDFTSMVATAEAGVSHPISVTVGGGWDYESVSVWIDYNNNFQFDSNEFTYIGTGSGSVVIGSISIPDDVAPGNYRMRVRVAADVGGNASWSMACDSSQEYGETEDYTISIIANDDPSYCEPILFCGGGDMITNVSFKEINNPTGCSTNGYGDYTSMIATAEAGQSHSISVSVGGGWVEEAVSVWIDYNNNFQFDWDEFTFIGTGSNSVVTGNISIPETVAPGNYRMRVRVIGDSPIYATWDMACDSSLYYGETEDYTLNIVEPNDPGCLEGTTQSPNTTVESPCYGEPFHIPNVIYGSYSKIAVNQGTEYIFSVSSSTDFITIGDENGTTVLAYGSGSVTWTAPETGVIRFYTHNDEDCTGDGNVVQRYVQCGTIPVITEPDFPCFQGDGLNSNNFEYGYDIYGAYWATADDFTVATGETFTVQQIRMNVYSNSNITNGTFAIRENTNNSPGDVIHTFSGTPSSSRIIGSNSVYDYDIHEVTFDLSTPIELSEGTYWLVPTLTNVSNNGIFWEVTTTGSNGNPVMESASGSESWNVISNGIYQAVFFISGVCEEVEETIEITVPDFPCYQGDGLNSNNFENGLGIFNTSYLIADDFVVSTGETFNVQQVRLNVFSDYLVTNGSFSIRTDASGVPGAEVANFSMAPSFSRIIGESYGFDMHEVTFDLATPIELEEGTYWLVPTLTNNVNSEVYWEMTTTGSLGNPTMGSDNSGSTWYTVYGGIFQAVFFISGVCEDVDEPIEITEPDLPCFQGDVLNPNGFEEGHAVFGNYRKADDFVVSTGQTFDVQQIRLFLYSNSEIVSTTFDFLSNNNDQPGTVIESVTMAPSYSRIIGTNHGYSIHEVHYDLANFIEFTEGRYWLSVSAQNAENTSVYWETTTSGTNGMTNYVSQNHGNSWYNLNLQSVFFIAGVCEDVEEPIEITVPDFPCYQGDGLESNLENGYGISGNFRTADDINVPIGEIFTVQQIRMNVLSATEVNNMTFYFRENSISNQPGDIVETITMTPTSSRLLGAFNQTLQQYELTFDLATPVVLEAGKHWLSPLATNQTNTSVYWEFTTTGSSGSTIQVSDVGGTVWSEYTQQAVFFVAGLCEDAPIEITVPDFPCFQGDGLNSNGFEDGTPVGQMSTTADDFVVAAGETFSLQQIRMNVFSYANITLANLDIRLDNAGLPASVHESISMAPSSSRIIGNRYGFDIHELTFDLATPIVLEEGRYWLSANIQNADNSNVYWEYTSTGTHEEFLKISTDGGNNWHTPYNGVQAVFFVAGVCEEVQEPGCLDTPNDYWPTYLVEPACTGIPYVVTDEGFTGEYSRVQLTAGTEYVFSTNVDTTFITIANEAGDTVLAYGTGSVTWTPATTGVYRFITHLNEDCDYSYSEIYRYITCGEIVPPPANDDCANAIAVACGDSVTGSTVTATNSGGNSAGDVFYTFTGTGVAQNVTLSLCDSEFDTVLRVFTDCTLATEIAFNDDECGSRSELTFESDGTSTYYIMVEGWGSNTGNYVLDVSCEDLDEEEPTEGCLEAENGAYPSTAYTPSCYGIPESITGGDWGWFGEYSLVNVTAGTEYIFSTDVATAFITIADQDGLVAYTTGTGSVTWTATATETIRYYTHENDDCLASMNWVDRMVQCGEIVPPPPYDPCAPIHEGIATNGVGFVNNGTSNYMAANDFNVLANTQFEVEKFTINVVTLGGEPTTFDMMFFEGETAVGAQFGETLTGITPSSITENGTFGSTGYPVYSVEITLPTTIIFPATATADKKYWVGISGAPTGSGNPVFWVSSDYVYTDTLPTYQSANGGATFELFVADSGANVEGDMIIDGECATLGLSDMSGAKFAYYPNPVDDVLSITSSKGVEKVEVFNLAGQFVMANGKVANGQVNVSTLTPGTYVFRVTLEGGQVETFKIIKKGSK
ncbi:GEVED domain-containing protein [Moheibacter stercoris]|uniref:Ribosomal protein S11 n=1 Tax=Moheibacter stercoris TaxID=1628251 RepID=A0ABV2LQ97_9FLAO